MPLTTTTARTPRAKSTRFKEQAVIERGLWALEEARRISTENGNCNMTLDDMNREISASRQAMSAEAAQFFKDSRRRASRRFGQLMEQMRQQAIANGVADMPIEEINAEIEAVRRGERTPLPEGEEMSMQEIDFEIEAARHGL